MRFGMWFSAFRARSGYPSSVSKSSAKPGSSCVVSVSGFSAIAFAARRAHPLPEAGERAPDAVRFRVHREPHRHRAERCRHVALLPVRIERDVVRMAHRALPGKVVDFVHPSPRQDAAPFQPHDEIMAFSYEKMPLAIDKRR